MKKLILSACAALLLPLRAAAGDIAAGSVPGSLNYQGRLERDNAPITGPIHLYFRIYNSATANNAAGGSCGGVAQPCLWQSPEIAVQATQGIFSADMTPPVSVLAGGAKLYMEVQVESDVLSPREPLNSVAYSLLAKKLEDGASVSVTTLTALNNVYLSTAPGAQAAVGTLAPDPGARLTVSGSLKIVGGSLVFPDNTSMNTANVGSASNISNVTDADVLADGNSDGAGDVLLRKPTLNFLRVTNSGKVGIGSAFTSDGGANPPSGLLDVDGALYVGNEGLYDRDDAELNVKQDLLVEGGKVTGMNTANVSLGESVGLITFNFGVAEKMRVQSNNLVGIGLTGPASMLHVAGDIRANAGVRGGVVSVGGYGGDWTGSANEVRAQNNSHLLLQQTNSYNVGIGTDTPREKLHVRGSIRSDYGIMASTASFGSDVRVNGAFTANSGAGNTVNLSSTVIYGTLQVTGGIGSLQGVPAYIGSTQTFTGQNSFLNQVVVSSDILTLNRVGAGVSDFDFPGTKYLQVGDNKPAFVNDNAMAYLVGGTNADAKLNFYRGASEIGRWETQTGASGAGLALTVGGQTKVFTDPVYHHIQNSAVWISTGYNTTPAIFVSSWMGNVGMGTSVMDPNWKLTVNGNLRLNGGGSALIFSDGTSLNTASALGSATNLSANGDAVVQSNADLTGGGDVILRAGALDGLVLNSGGNVGVGTMFPQSKLNVRGDVMIGNTFNPYSGDSSEDLVVGGNIAFDGSMVQRSAVPVYLSKLVVASDVYLSTTAGTRTGIGNVAPGYTLDVTGDINAANSLYTGGTARVSNTGVVGSGGANATWDGVTINVNRGGTGATTLTSGGVLYGNGTGAIGAMGVQTNGQLLIGNGAGAPTAATLTPTVNQVNVTNGAGAITLSLPQNIHAAASPTFAGVTLTGLTSGGLLYGGGAGAIGATPVLTNGQLLVGNGAGAPTAATLTPTANQVNVTNAAGSITLSLPQDIHTGARPAFASITATSSGTFRNSGANNYSIETASGILVNSGVINMTGGKVINLAIPDIGSDAANKTYVDAQAGGSGGLSWSKSGNIVTGSDYLGSINSADVVFARNGLLNEKLRLVAAGVNVTGNLGVTGTVDGYDISVSGPNWDTAYTLANAATSANTASAIVRRDASGNFSAGTITATFSGNATTSTNATNHIADATGGVHGATNLNSVNMIVRRDASGNFNAGTITAASFSGPLTGNVTGNADTATNATNHIADGTGGVHGATSVNTGNMIVRRDASGNFNAGTITAAAFSGPLTGNVTGNASGTAANVTGTVAVGNGGTGATTAANARTNLGLGSGLSGSYTIASSTSATGTPCNSYTFTNGILTAVSAGFACP